MTEQEEFEFRHRLEQENKPSIGSILPQVMQEAAHIGMPNIANQIVGDTAASIGGLDQLDPNTDPHKDTRGIEDTSLSDASNAMFVASPLMKGTAEFAAPQLERIGRNQTLKGFGGSLRQIREMGKKGGLDDSAQFANEKGFNDVFSTSLGREKLLEDLDKTAGAKLGALRKEGGTSPLSQESLEAEVLADPTMAPFLGSGRQSVSKAAIPQIFDDIKRVSGPNPTFASRAAAATDLNATAAGNKIYQPTTVDTTVANILSRKNNEGLHAALGPEKATQEIAARQEFSNLQPLKHLQEHGELREISGHNLGLFGTAKSLLPTGMVTRGVAKGAYALGGVTTRLLGILKSNPAQLGQYAAPLLKAAQTGGNQGLAATHYILSLQHPEYNSMIQGDSEQP